MVEERGRELGEPALQVGPDGVTMAMVEGRCAFLQIEDARCALHAGLEREAKPLGCRQFPFLIRPTPEGIQVGISFSCTAARENLGRPLAAHEGEIRALLDQWTFQPVGEAPLQLGRGVEIGWAEYLQLEALLLEGLDAGAPGAAIGRGLGAVCRVVAGEQPWREALARARALPFARAGALGALEGFFLASLVGTLEAEGPEARALTEALLGGGRLRLTRFGWEGQAEELAASLQALGRWDLEAEVVRYLKALLFVKTPARGRCLLDGLTLLYLLPPLLGWYTAASAACRGAERPSEEDWHRALDVAERELVTHGRGLEPLLAAFGEAFVSELGPVV